jgi:fructose-1-phosphate kinase PfkB-like protein
LPKNRKILKPGLRKKREIIYSLVAGFIKGMVEGLDINGTIKIGMAAGTANVAGWDVAAVTLDVIEKYISKIKVEQIR